MGVCSGTITFGEIKGSMKMENEDLLLFRSYILCKNDKYFKATVVSVTKTTYVFRLEDKLGKPLKRISKYEIQTKKMVMELLNENQYEKQILFR
jgi:hypothetical protein